GMRAANADRVSQHDSKIYARFDLSLRESCQAASDNLLGTQFSQLRREVGHPNFTGRTPRCARGTDECVRPCRLPDHCFSPRRASKYARMKGWRSPSSTRSTSPTSVLVRWSLTMR